MKQLQRNPSCRELPPRRETRMFGGLAFLLDGKMFCGIAKDKLMVRVRVGPDRHEAFLRLPNVGERTSSTPVPWSSSCRERGPSLFLTAARGPAAAEPYSVVALVGPSRPTGLSSSALPGDGSQRGTSN
jgi:hypothetical protein